MREFLDGMRLFGRGLRIVTRSPRLLLTGAVPAVLTTLLLLAAVVVLLLRIDDITGWVTPFAQGWSDPWRQLTRVVAGLAVLGVVGFVLVVTFTALTLLVGGPFYEHIAETVEDSLGGAPEQPTSWLRTTARGLRDSVLLIGASLLCAVPLLLAGLIPLVGQTVVPVLVVCVGSWLLALELVGVAFARRGLKLRDRQRALRNRRALTLGATVPAYLLCAIPFAAIVVMPVAVVGGTLLAREVLGVDRPVTTPSPAARERPGRR